MGARAFDNCKLPSRHVTEAPSHAPHRAHAISRVPQTMCALGDGSAGKADWLAIPCTAVPSTLENVKFDWDQEVVCHFADPISASGEVVGRQRSRARDGAIVKVVAMTRLEAPAEGPIALAIDAHESTFDLHASEADLAMRRMASRARPNSDQSGTVGNDADRVGPAGTGAHGDGRAEVVGYADI
jgi:hypothetical protein